MSAPGDGYGAAMASLEELLVAAERDLPAPALERARQIVGALLDAHREGLSALVRSLEATDEGRRSLRAAAETEPGSSLLALHGLHPDPIEARVRRAVAAADEAAGKRGLAELSSVNGADVVVLVRGRDAAAGERIESLVRSAVAAHAPEAAVFIERPRRQPENLIPLERLRERAGAER